MNPNSQHQIWSRWTVTAVLQHRASHDDPRFHQRIELEHAHVLRGLFGSAGEARVMRVIGVVRGVLTERWTLEGRVEGPPVHDPVFRARVYTTLRAHYQRGFGSGAVVTATAALEAGDAQDGAPPAQLLILPSLHDEELAHGMRRLSH
jgi:hypothetical protein